MENEIDYIQKNREAWNSRTDHHFASAFYDMDGFLRGKNSLNDIELKLLGDVSSKSILHLQCHFGQDSLSLGRMGAIVTGVDLSDKAIGRAEALSRQTNIAARFICCDIYELPGKLDQSFDLVFTSYGTIGWLPDLDKWAAVIAGSLKRGGKLVFVEFHPVLWMFDNNFEKIEYNYKKSNPIIEIEAGTYADKTAAITTETVTWNHGISEVVNSLVNHGMEIASLDEYDYSPYNCFNSTEEYEKGKFRIKQFGNKIPMVYSISAIKK